MFCLVSAFPPSSRLLHSLKFDLLCYYSCLFSDYFSTWTLTSWTSFKLSLPLFFWICLCSSQICKILCCVWSWKMIELKQSIEALNSCGVLSCILFRTYVAWQLPDKLPTLFLIKSLLCSKFEVKSFSVYFLLFPYPKNFSKFFSSHWKK